ncbi:MAG: malonyl-CoA decarboxylase, partial [Nocardiopsis sp. BM-2018]
KRSRVIALQKGLSRAAISAHIEASQAGIASMSFFTEMMQQITERGRALMHARRGDARTAQALQALAEALLSNRGEASGVARAAELLDCYAAAPREEREGFLRCLALDFGPDQSRIDAAIAAYQAEPGATTAMALHRAAEPRRQDLLRRLNRAPGGTLALLRMREDVLPLRRAEPALADLDADFEHLFASWFNRGFLTLRRIDWASPAHVLEKIIQYEAVHRIENFEDLKLRLAPSDRLLYAFFHPALADEPLIFVEVALTDAIPQSIERILDGKRAELAPEDADTAVFYSISNCQKGLAGVSFGNFLIKQVVEELRRDLPQLRRFVTLSPVPGFAAWLETQARDTESGALEQAEREMLAPLLAEGADRAALLARDDAETDKLNETLRRLCATYLVHARMVRGARGVPRPVDPVARFHLGNGARLEHVHARADLSPRGTAQAAGMMVNYLYDLDSIERHHEAYAERGEVAVSNEVRRLAKPQKALRDLAVSG